MRYFSSFAGIGGFEIGIQKAYVGTIDRSKNGGSEENTPGSQERGQGLESKEGKEAEFSHGQPGQHAEHGIKRREPYCVGYSEIDKYAIQIYEKHFDHKNYGDITKINPEDLPDFELFVGGFPCQAFSIAGKRGGFNDTRGTLFFDIARILATKRPKLFLLENVKGLLSHDGGRTFGTILATIDELGYDSQWQVLNSKSFGIPQNRERIYIVGHLRGERRPEVFPIGESDQISHGSLKIIRNSIYDTDRLYSPGGVARTMRANAGGKGAKTGLYQMKKDDMIRRLTPTECERLMGFPDGWTSGMSDSQRYKMLGNAVISNVVAEIVKRLI